MIKLFRGLANYVTAARAADRRLGPISSILALSAVLPSLGGCASLPSNGPTSPAIRRGAMDGSTFQYRIEEIASPDATIFHPLAQPVEPSLVAFLGHSSLHRDALQPGDVLQVRIYEIGISLFSGPPSTTMAGTSNDLTAHNESFDSVTVEEDGSIFLPYIGRVKVSGLSLRDTEARLRSAMRGRSQNAEVIVNRTESPATSYAVAGNVRRPGLFPLGPASRTLLDAILVAGGQIDEPYDDVVRLTRNGVSRSVRLNEIDPADNSFNITIAPGDRIQVLHQPLTFLSLGAGGKVAQIPFDAERVTLAEAIAKLGGPNDSQANPRAVFLFRNERSEKPGEPFTVYRLNMMSPSSYILSQRIAMKDKDLIYIANASANLPAKFVSIVNQLFSPVVTLRAVSH